VFLKRRRFLNNRHAQGCVSETSEVSKQLTGLSAREDFVQFCRRGSLKTCNRHIQLPQFHILFNPGARWEWVVNAKSRAFYPPGKSPGTYCTGDLVGPTVGLDGCIKLRPHRDSIPGPSSLYRVAILTALSRSPFKVNTGMIPQAKPLPLSSISSQIHY
jgi:hypothetical protein